MTPLALADRFALPSEAAEAIPFGNGHINDTFRIRCKDGSLFLLQRINTHVFRNADGLMENIEKVTSFLRQRIEKDGGDASRSCLTLIPAKDGGLTVNCGDGVFRMYRFIERSLSFDRGESPVLFEKAGFAFGAFLKQLDAFDASLLTETIPHFHHTPKRYEALEEAVKKDAVGRLGNVSEELASIRKRADRLSILTDGAKDGSLPLRVTHNDTKINNVLFDESSGEPLCVVDLDTVMPGLSLYDFGDAVRSGAALSAEDDPNPEHAGIDLALFGAYTKGFLSACREILTAEEIRLLPMGAWMMTMENAIRFLTDYLCGDIYFKIATPDHNLRRTRNQLALAASMEANMTALEQTTASLANTLCQKQPM